MMESNEVSMSVEKVLAELKATGYSEATIKGYRQKYDGLIAFCEANSIERYTESVGQRYLANIAETRSFKARESPEMFGRVIRRLDCALNDLQWKPRAKELMPYEESVFSESVKAYEQYLQSKKSPDYRDRVRITARFLRQVENLGCRDLKELDAKLIYDVFVGDTLNAEYFGRIVKPFLKYAFTYGLTVRNLSLICPSRKRRKNVPSVYTPEEVERVLAAVAPESANGKRDYAIILVAARLGLRAGDISKLKMDNVSFADSTIRIVQSKTKKPLELPMSEELTTALRDYIDNERADVRDEHIFLKQFGRGTITGTAVSAIVHKAFVLAGIDCAGKKSGSHALRASLATALLNEGNDYAVIRDVLGHSDIQIAKAYVKTEIEKLRANALPVPPATKGFEALLSDARRFSHE